MDDRWERGGVGRGKERVRKDGKEGRGSQRESMKDGRGEAETGE